MTPCQFIRPLPSYKPMRTIILLVQQEISPTCQPGTSRQIHHTTQPFQEMFLGNDINDTNITLGIMFGRRRCNNLYILNLPGRNLFQSLRSGKDTGLSIYINQKTRTTPEGDFAFGINPNRRCILQYVNSRTATSHHIGRSFNYFLI